MYWNVGLFAARLEFFIVRLNQLIRLPIFLFVTNVAYPAIASFHSSSILFSTFIGSLFHLDCVLLASGHIANGKRTLFPT